MGALRRSHVFLAHLQSEQGLVQPPPVQFFVDLVFLYYLSNCYINTRKLKIMQREPAVVRQRRAAPCRLGRSRRQVLHHGVAREPHLEQRRPGHHSRERRDRGPCGVRRDVLQRRGRCQRDAPPRRERGGDPLQRRHRYDKQGREVSPTHY